MSENMPQHNTSMKNYSEVRVNEPHSDVDSPVHSCAENNANEKGIRSDEDDEYIFDDVKMILRKRRGWGHEDSLCSNDLDLLEDDDVLAEEDDAGCPLPSTPEDTQLIEAEVRQNNTIEHVFYSKINFVNKF